MATLFASGSTTGSASVSGSAALSQILSGTAVGSGVLSIPPLLASGTALGGSTVTGDALLTIGVSGLIQGQGTLFLSGVPDTIFGTSSLTGELVVEQAPPPVCTCRIPKPTSQVRCSCGGLLVSPSAPCLCSGEGGPYRWNELFQPGNLSLFLRDSSGPINPASVSFTLYWLRNGIPYQAGVAGRVPVRGPNVGQFYVTGRVGEFGQPGDWLVRWRYQRFFFSEINEVEFRFVVQDALAAADPRDTTRRILKYGWG